MVTIAKFLKSVQKVQMVYLVITVELPQDIPVIVDVIAHSLIIAVHIVKLGLLVLLEGIPCPAKTVEPQQEK